MNSWEASQLQLTPSPTQARWSQTKPKNEAKPSQAPEAPSPAPDHRAAAGLPGDYTQLWTGSPPRGPSEKYSETMTYLGLSRKFRT